MLHLIKALKKKVMLHGHIKKQKFKPVLIKNP
jgi:hypothetical protein